VSGKKKETLKRWGGLLPRRKKGGIKDSMTTEGRRERSEAAKVEGAVRDCWGVIKLDREKKREVCIGLTRKRTTPDRGGERKKGVGRTNQAKKGK